MKNVFLFNTKNPLSSANSKIQNCSLETPYKPRALIHTTVINTWYCSSRNEFVFVLNSDTFCLSKHLQNRARITALSE